MDAVPEIRKYLGDEEVHFHAWSNIAVAAPALSALRGNLTNESEYAREAAEKAICSIEPDHLEHLPP